MSDDLILFWDRQGQPITDVLRWGELYEDPEYRFLRRTPVGNGEVITAWLGIDQGYGEEGPPLIFGTIVSVSGVGFLDNSEVLAATEEDALRHHDEMVRAYG